MCCLLASQQEIDDDPAVYDCDGCVMAQELGALDRDNAEAWGLFHRVCGRFAHEAGLMGMRVNLETDGWPAQDVLDLLDRLEIIYHHLVPPQEPRRGA